MLDMRRTSPERMPSCVSREGNYLSPQRGHRGDQAHSQDHRQPTGIRGFRNPMGRGKAKAKPKEAKEMSKGKGKGHVNEMQNFRGSPRGAVQSEHWDPESDLNSLLPICADENCRARFLGTCQDPQSWTRGVKSAPNILSFQDQPIYRMQVCSVGRRHGQVVPSFQCRTETTRSKTENECISKRSFSLLIAPVSEGVDDPEFTRRADELRQKCCAEYLSRLGDDISGLLPRRVGSVHGLLEAVLVGAVQPGRPWRRCQVHHLPRL